MSKKWGIKHNVLILALAPAIIISLLLSGYFTSLRLNELTAALENRGVTVTSKLASQAEYGLFTDDLEALVVLGRKELNNEISRVAFYNNSGIEITSVGKLGTNILSLPINNLSSVRIKNNIENDSIEFTLPITIPEIAIDDYSSASRSLSEENIKSFIIGWIKIEVERKATRIKEYQILLHSTMIMLLCLVISGFLAFRLGSKVTEPLLAITRAVERIRQGKLDTRVKTKAKWELAILESGVNAMASSLQAGHEELRKNIEQATADLRHTLETIEVQNVELNISRKEAEDASKVKSEFLADMSHELRTPLNGIIGFINLLQKSNLTDRQQDYITTIQKSSNSLLSIINDILDFSKIEAGKLYLDIEPMSISECVEDTLTLLAPSAHEKNIELIPFIYEDVPTKIKADSLRIKQVMINLVSNAIKFTYEGSVIVRVMLENETKNEATLHVSVQDTGIGLSEDQKKKLFDAFNQLNPKITRKFGGTGLGLVICKKLVEQMHGKIDLESSPRKGSTFWFTLKVEKVEEKSENHYPSIFKQTNILLFEPHPITRITIKNLLIKWGFNVHEIYSHTDIEKTVKYAHISGNPFQLTIIGVNQPKPKNCLITSIRKAIEKPYACFVGVIANTTDHLVHSKILEEGATLCLAKPICQSKLYTALSDVFDNKSSNEKINHSITKVKVLVVDDNYENLKLATALLESIGTDVTTVNSGKDALIATKEIDFNMILMDIHMPNMDGIETAKAIRKYNTNNKNIPIVALSAHILLSEKTDLQKAQVNDYITKPVNENQLRAIIYKWTHRGTGNFGIIKSINKHSSKAPIEKKPLKSISWELAKKLAAGNMDMAKDMLKMLIKSLPKEKNIINKAYDAKDRKVLFDAIHKLHGGCCYTGTPKLKNIVKLLETSLEVKTLEELSPLIQKLNLEIDNIINIWPKELEMLSKSEYETTVE